VIEATVAALIASADDTADGGVLIVRGPFTGADVGMSDSVDKIPARRVGTAAADDGIVDDRMIWAAVDSASCG
jgi:hypothetical protein